jgi:hypothetical protein
LILFNLDTEQNRGAEREKEMSGQGRGVVGPGIGVAGSGRGVVGPGQWRRRVRGE